MGAPQTVDAKQFGYTLTTVAVAVAPGTWLWTPIRSRIALAFASFDAGNGPSGSDFDGRWLQNGSPAFTFSVTDGDDSDITTIGFPTPFFLQGDLIQVEVTADGGSTGPVEMGFVYY
jgi:hypothetical protein